MAFDAIVVGSGPAGATAARELAAAGSRVLVLDKESFPRYKACGGGIPLRTERMLPFPIDSVVEDSVDTLDVAYFGRHRFIKRSGPPFAHMVMRDRFDHLLLQHAQHAGAEFRPGSRVRQVEQTAGGVTVRSEDGFEASAPFLVAADGAHSPVGKMAGLGGGIAECAAWEVEVQAPAAVRRRYRSRSLIELGFEPWGYAWLFPKANVLSIGIVIPPEQAGDMKAQVRAYIDRLGLANAPVEIARGHKIRFRRGHEQIANAQVLLAGDAAGLADEFTEEGISYAVHSGRLAAKAVLKTLGASPQHSALRTGHANLRFDYEGMVDAEIMPELRAARAIAHMFYGVLGRAPGPWMVASRFTPFLWNAFFAVQRGESTYAREAGRIPLLERIANRQLAGKQG